MRASSEILQVRVKFSRLALIRSLSRFARLRTETFEQAVDEGALALQHFLACFLGREPRGAVDFGKGLLAPALRRPLHLEQVGPEPVRIEVAFDRESRNHF